MTTYHWVESDGKVPTFGPFDTERDAEIARQALSQACDWRTWSVVTTFVEAPF